ncbi:MAG: RNA polymerase sigma factor [Capsulimonadales bacterium]|nr:RNA polymerase sigma factor [Capsulimonadales bacterium]
MEIENEKNLLRSAKAGDNRAFARLCEAHRLRVWRTVATVTGNGSDTDDLAQEAILKAWTALPTYRGDAPFGAWLCRIALNVAHDHVRSAWKRRVLSWGAIFSHRDTGRESDIALPLPGPSEETQQREMQRQVRREVARLKAQERVPIWLMFFEGFSLAEVARLEGLPESTVRSRVKAGLRRLERTLADWNPTLESEPPIASDWEDFPERTPGNERQAAIRRAVRPPVGSPCAVEMERGYSR